MAQCRPCNWLSKKICAGCAQSLAALWEHSSRWESQESNEWELWEANSLEHADTIDFAMGLLKSDPVAALGIFRELAESGSVWCMEMTGWLYDEGVGAPVDFAMAQEYYYRALCAGSWTATIGYARLLERHGYHDYWPGVLDDGIRAKFVPASYWKAWLTYRQSRSRKMARQVKPLLDFAAARGHPGAQLTLALLTGRGKFGLWQIPKSFRMIRESLKLTPDKATVRNSTPANSPSAGDSVPPRRSPD